MYTRCTCTYTIYTPNHTSKYPKCTLYAPYMHPIYTTILSGKGQTIHVMIIPEVARLISAELARARSAPEQIKAAEALLQFDLMEQQRQQTGGAAGAGGAGGAGGVGSGSSPVGTLLGVSMGGGGADGNDDEPPIGLTVPGDRHTLCGVSGWLVINSMRSERLQFELLCEQVRGLNTIYSV